MSPGNEQRDYWGSQAADTPGSRNFVGIKNPAVDALIERVIFAKDRAELVAATRALDRVLLWNHYVVPQFTIDRFALRGGTVSAGPTRCRNTPNRHFRRYGGGIPRGQARSETKGDQGSAGYAARHADSRRSRAGQLAGAPRTGQESPSGTALSGMAYRPLTT